LKSPQNTNTLIFKGKVLKILMKTSPQLRQSADNDTKNRSPGKARVRNSITMDLMHYSYRMIAKNI